MNIMAKSVTARRVVLTSFWVDALDIILNLAVTLVTGSVVMVAELTQGVSDLLASGLLIIGLHRPKKEIYFWTLSSTLVMLLLASSLSFYFGLKRFLHPQEIENILIAYMALIVSVVSNGYAFILSAQRILKKGASFRKVFQEFEASSLIMTKNTFVLDLMGMSAALVGLIALILYQVFGNLRFDGLGAMGIGIVLALLSLRLVVDMTHMPSKKILGKEL
jgi:divalent metal cation (Fe/Co/Zn/Cd) transporter